MVVSKNLSKLAFNKKVQLQFRDIYTSNLLTNLLLNHFVTTWMSQTNIQNGEFRVNFQDH